MRKTVVKLLLCIVTVVCLSCMFMITASAAAPAIKDGGYYTIRNISADRYVSVSGAGEVSFDEEISADSLFEISVMPDGSCVILPLGASGRGLCICSDSADGQGMSLVCRDAGDACSRFDIGVRDGLYTVSTPSADGGVMYLTLEDRGISDYALLLGDEGEYSSWSIEEYLPESLSLSLYSLQTKPYTSFTDLRAVITPSFMAEHIKWTSEDRNVVIVDDGGKFCALSEGKVTLTATFGTKSVSCEVTVSMDDDYAWFSQNNVSTGGWNGDPLYNLYFKAGGVKKRYAANNSTKKTDWMSEGCAICSIAQVLRNMGARYTNGYDFRSGIDGNIISDPYTVSLANTGNRGPESGKTTLKGDPVYLNTAAIAEGFNKDGAQVTVELIGYVTKKAIKEALDDNPWGVVVCFKNSAYGMHYITFNRCLNPEEKNPNKYIFTVSDPASVNAENADDVIFEESYSYKRLYYRFSHALQMQIWSYEQ